MAFFNDFGYKVAGLRGFEAVRRPVVRARPVYRTSPIAPRYQAPTNYRIQYRRR